MVYMPDPAQPHFPHALPVHPPPWAGQRDFGSSDPKANRVLGALTDAAFQRWLPDLEAVEMPLGRVLRESGHPPRHVYFPTTAIVAVMYGLEDGRTGAVAVVGNEGLVGVSTFMGGGGAPGSSVVLCAGRGYRLGTAALMVEFERGGPVTQLLLRHAQAWMTQVAQGAVCNRHHDIDSRLCRLLLSTLDRRDGGSGLVMTQELMAGVLGVRREGITEAALNLQRQGVLHYQRGHVTVLDRAGLERRSCECYAAVKNECERLLPAAPVH